MAFIKKEFSSARKDEVMLLSGLGTGLTLTPSTARLTHRLLEAVGQPAVAQHSQHGGGRVLQVLKSIHEDEVQHNIKETHAHHLSGSGTVRKGYRF